jgi:Ser/Thr protein kinase RdoA (MazF antagonist)
MLHRRRRFVMFLVHGGPKRYVIKLARTTEENGQIEAELRNLKTLSDHPAAKEIFSACPVPYGRGRYNGCTFIVLSWLPGRKHLLFDAGDQSALNLALDWIARLHAATWNELPVTPGGAAEEVCRAAGLDEGPGILPVELRRVVEAASAELVAAGGGYRPAVFAHNDLTTANLLFDGDTLGVIDWGLASPTGFPVVDVVTLAHHLLTKGRGMDPVDAFKAVGFNAGKQLHICNVVRRYLSRVRCPAALRHPLLRAFVAIQILRAHAESPPARARQMAACLELLEQQTDVMQEVPA